MWFFFIGVFLLAPLTSLLHCHPWLSGESVPVMKTPLPVSEVKYSPESQRRHTLFCGTQIIQAKGGCLSGKGAIAVVTRTGNSEHRILLQWVIWIWKVFRNSFWWPGFSYKTRPVYFYFFSPPQAFSLLKVTSSAPFSTHSQLTSDFIQMPWSFYLS